MISYLKKIFSGKVILNQKQAVYAMLLGLNIESLREENTYFYYYTDNDYNCFMSFCYSLDAETNDAHSSSLFDMGDQWVFHSNFNLSVYTVLKILLFTPKIPQKEPLGFPVPKFLKEHKEKEEKILKKTGKKYGKHMEK